MCLVVKAYRVCLSPDLSVAFVHQAADDFGEIFEVLGASNFDALVLLNSAFEGLHSKLGKRRVTGIAANTGCVVVCLPDLLENSLPSRHRPVFQVLIIWLLLCLKICSKFGKLPL